MDVMAICNMCGTTETVKNVSPVLWERYLSGALVQKVWPTMSAEDREILIGARTGMHTCNECWESYSDEGDAA